MVADKIERFSGMQPALDSRLIGNSQADLSQNAWLYSGTLQGTRTPTALHTCILSSTECVFRIPNNFLDSQHLADSIWLEFTDINTDIVRAPIVGDSFDRYYFASSSQQMLYNTAARMAATSGGAQVLGAANGPFILGIPAPTVAPTLVSSGGVSSVTVTRSYVQTYVSQYGEEGPPGPPVTLTGKQDDTWTVTGVQPTQTDILLTPTGCNRNIRQTRIYRTVTAANGQASFFLVQTLPCGGQATASEHTNTTLDSLQQTQTLFDATLYTAAGFAVTGAHVAANSVINTVNSAVSVTLNNATTQTAAELVTFIPRYVDSLTDAVVSLNAILPSTTWTGPPSTLVGYQSMPNGMLAAWQGKEVWFCEPFRPHAWPAQYALAVDYPIVGMGVIGQTLIVCTEGSPYTMTGLNPASVTQSKIAVLEPCSNRASVVSTQMGVFYTSPSGLIYISATAGAALNVTKQMVTKEQWLKLVPSLPTMQGAYVNGAYYGWGTSRPGVFGAALGLTEGIPNVSTSFEPLAFQQTDFSGAINGFIFDPSDPVVGFNTLFNLDPIVTVFNDPWTNELCLIRDNIVYEVDFSALTPAYDTYLWRSKIFQMPFRKNLGAFRVWFDVPAGTPPQNPTRITDQTALLTFPAATGQYGIVRVYADEVLIVSREIRTNGEIMRIPGGQKNEFYQFELTGIVNIKSLEWASSAKELQKV